VVKTCSLLTCTVFSSKMSCHSPLYIHVCRRNAHILKEMSHLLVTSAPSPSRWQREGCDLRTSGCADELLDINLAACFPPCFSLLVATTNSTKGWENRNSLTNPGSGGKCRNFIIPFVRKQLILPYFLFSFFQSKSARVGNSYIRG
jgi:hypothetical protein